MRWLCIGLITISAVGGTLWYKGWFDSYRYPGYLPIACLERISPGESCVQQGMSESEREIIMGDDSFDHGGYVVSKARPGYLNLIGAAMDESNRLRDRSSKSPALQEMKRCGGGRELIGAIPEFPGRWSALYRLGEGRMMLTRTDFWSYGGKSGKFDVGLNFKVHGAPASLTLTRESADGPALWDIGWVREGVSFGATIEDRVKDDRPLHYAPRELIQLAEAIDGVCHWSREKLPDNDFPPNIAAPLPGQASVAPGLGANRPTAQ